VIKKNPIRQGGRKPGGVFRLGRRISQAPERALSEVLKGGGSKGEKKRKYNLLVYPGSAFRFCGKGSSDEGSGVQRKEAVSANKRKRESRLSVGEGGGLHD